jgi:hypothetical protein
MSLCSKEEDSGSVLAQMSVTVNKCSGRAGAKEERRNEGNSKPNGRNGVNGRTREFGAGRCPEARQTADTGRGIGPPHNLV